MNRPLTLLVLAVVAVALVSGCSPSDGAEPAATTVAAETSTLPEPPSEGPVAEFLISFDAEQLGGAELPRSIGTERMRTVAAGEQAYVEAVRDDPAHTDAALVFDTLGDEAVLYLGYLFCAAHDASESINTSITVVVDVVARSGGRPANQPVDADFIASVTMVNHASGSLCAELYLETQGFLEELLGSQ